MDQSEYLESLEDLVIPPEKASQKHRPLVPSEQTAPPDWWAFELDCARL